MQTEVFCSRCDSQKAYYTYYKADGGILTREIPTSGDVHSHPLPLRWVTSNGRDTYMQVQFLSQ